MFSNGVIFLAVASVLIIVFNGDISSLIPLYAFGVFTGFTLSQAGMVRHHLKEKQPNWKVGMVINAIGSVSTGFIAMVVVVSKFTEGAWIPAALIPIMVFGFRAIGKHYKRSRGAVVAPPGYRAPRETHTMVVLVGGVNKGVLRAVQYAKSLNPDRIMAVTVASNDEERKVVEDQWKAFEVPIELHTVYSPYRELTRPILKFIDELDEQHSDDIITVVIPEFVTSVGTQWLHNGSAFALKAKLLYRPHTAVVSVPIHTMGDHTESSRSPGMHVIVVGCGRVGSEVALNLAATEHDVIVIDRKLESFRRLGDDFKGTTMVGVGFDRDVLTEAGITPNCAVAAVTSGDNSNILIARVARETFGVKHVVARIYDPAAHRSTNGGHRDGGVGGLTSAGPPPSAGRGDDADWIDPSAKFTIVERRVPPRRQPSVITSRPRQRAGSGDGPIGEASIPSPATLLQEDDVVIS